ncbi:hypothetical protein [Leifsonia sp. Leaf264]|uniref:hypothetical protein n=1 Tax=Leifsonia sp. Leaf264 TaxID=1736314 RepID=UPI000A6BF69B|nr:hypothetical protein [Leifsonia sp. Leaf264]
MTDSRPIVRAVALWLVALFLFGSLLTSVDSHRRRAAEHWIDADGASPHAQKA